MRPLFLVVVAALGFGTGNLTAQAKTQFRARLSTVPIDVAMQSAIAGRGSATATLHGNVLTIAGEFAELKSSATVAKLHRGPAKGIRGPAIFDVSASPGLSGKLAATVELTPAQVDDLTAGRLYLQLHSEKAPEGNLWGWLLPQQERR